MSDPTPTPAILPGSLPGLLTRGCPIAHSRTGARGIVTGYAAAIVGYLDVSWDGGLVSRVVSPGDVVLDLSDPAGMDRGARYLAERVGLTCGATAPAWGRYVCGEHCADGDTGRMERCSRHIWSLMGADGLDPVEFAECGIEAPDDREIAPGISTLTNPAAALALAVLAVSGGFDV